MRYSMRRLLIGMTLASIYLAVVFAAPPRLALVLLGLLSFVMPAIYAGGVIYARGSGRAFWIGTAVCGVFPAVWVNLLMLEVVFDLDSDFWLRLLERSDTWDDFEEGIILTIAQVLPQLGGVACVAMQRMSQPQLPENSPSNSDDEPRG